MSNLLHIHIGKITQDRNDLLTVPRIQETYGQYVDVLSWLDERQCKIEFERYIDMDLDMFVHVITALMDETTWVEYRLTWK